MEGRIDQVHPEQPQRLGLQGARGVPHVDVEHDLVRLAVRPVLEPDPHPAVTLVGAGIVAGRDGVGERKEAAAGAPALAKLTLELRPLALEHRLEPLPRDVARARAVEVIADFLVVGGDRLGDRAGRGAGREEPARHLLARTDLGERSEDRRVEIEVQDLLVSAERLEGVRFVRHGAVISKTW